MVLTSRCSYPDKIYNHWFALFRSVQHLDAKNTIPVTSHLMVHRSVVCVDVDTFLHTNGDVSFILLTALNKEPGKLKARPKGRPSKNSMSPRTYGAQCPACGKTFNNSSALAKHKLTHSDERKYVCQLCSKAFKRQDHL